MATQYNGDGTIPTVRSFATLSISSSTNATPIVVTTSTNHGYATGDTVDIEGHAVNTNANGLHTITVLTANTFSLNGSTGNGVGAATGQVTDYAISPTWQIISDGDVLNGANLNTAPEAAANTVPFLFQRVGSYRLIDMKQHADGSIFTTFSTTALNSSTWTDLGVTVQTGNRYLLANDILILRFFSSVSATSNSSCAFTFAINFNGTGAQEQTQFAMDFLPSNSGIVIGQTLQAAYLYSGGGIAIPYAVSIVGKSNAATPNLILSGPQQLTIQHYRPNS